MEVSGSGGYGPVLLMLQVCLGKIIAQQQEGGSMAGEGQKGLE